ncbi:MAG: outer membrane beta-barrel protein [Draconibacterium sp.]|nr:outer membrane beta-barrel protein [Draconibacterium sp.]
MKQFITLILCNVLIFNLSAQNQDTTEIKILKKNIVTVIDDNDKVQVKVGNDRGIEVITDDWGDTTQIRIGRRTFKVIDGDNGTYLKVDKEISKKNWPSSFNAHWAGLEVGMNIVQNADYSMYGENQPEFFELNPGKSLSWNLNFAEFAFKNERKTFAVVTGMGISFNDYTFDLPITIEKEDGFGIIVPRNLEEDGSVKKSKLHVNYLTAPLLLEIKTPLRMGSSRLFIAGGVIGGLYLGSHTKYKFYKGDKQKAESNYHINQWKYDVTGRISFGDFCVFANYSMTSLFKKGKGPEIYPLMIGVSFPNI